MSESGARCRELSGKHRVVSAPHPSPTAIELARPAQKTAISSLAPRAPSGERDRGEGFVDIARDQALSQTFKSSSSPPLCGREAEVTLGFIALCLNSIAVHPDPHPPDAA